MVSSEPNLSRSARAKSYGEAILSYSYRVLILGTLACFRKTFKPIFPVLS